MAEEKVETFYVVAHPDNEDRLGLWERHPDHPGGEVFVAGQDSAPVLVADTPGVREALSPTGGERGPNSGPPRLVRLEGGALSARQDLAKRVAEQRSLSRQQAALATSPATDESVKREADIEARLAKLEEDLHEARQQAAESVQQAAVEADEEHARAVEEAREGVEGEEPRRSARATRAARSAQAGNVDRPAAGTVEKP